MYIDFTKEALRNISEESADSLYLYGGIVIRLYTYVINQWTMNSKRVDLIVCNYTQ